MLKDFSWKSRPAHEAEVGDIIAGLKKLDSKEEGYAIFVGRTYDRIPKCAPEEIDLISVVQRLGYVEKLTSKLERLVAKNTNSVNKVLEMHALQQEANERLAKEKDTQREDPGPKTQVTQQQLSAALATVGPVLVQSNQQEPQSVWDKQPQSIKQPNNASAASA